MFKYRLFALIILLITIAMKPDKPAYKLFDAAGKEIKYDKMIKDLLKADVIFFGELHNNPISHWMQLELTKDLHQGKKEKLILGAEMFERDNALILREYLNNSIKTSNFENEARLWPNYKTDYKPLVEYARDSGIRFIATNIPRRYASIVHKKGFEGLDALDEEAKAYMPPLPIRYDPELGCYKKMMEMQGMGDHVNDNFPKAQAIKDATMAHFIVQNLETEDLFLHFNGAFHSDHKEGIVWYVMQERPDLSVVTITTVEQDDITELEKDSKGKADFIITVPSSMTKTY